VLVVHGFGDTPQSVGELARALHADGWTVHVPLLPGHGRSLAAFAASGAAEWRQAVREAHAALAARHASVALVGQSMGGALAVELAAALGAACPARRPARPLPRRAARRALGARGGARCWARILPVLSSDGGPRSIHDPEARAAALGPGLVTPGLARELVRVVDGARAALPHVAAPTLVVQSVRDHRIAPSAATAAFGRLGAATGAAKRFEWLDGCGHVVAADRQRERVRALAAAWLADHVGRRPRSTPHGGAASVSPLPA
jgi:carboxylesterase